MATRVDLLFSREGSWTFCHEFAKGNCSAYYTLLPVRRRARPCLEPTDAESGSARATN